ncbi:NAD(P)/FAD-dependent oxidoreductase [Flexibacterium corallicola]|uniref:NAD(P)/FAD-dependent oxidoreductase n=1 Tax=Flexibacterium corallicola TaxID=3037259 RepID=UPI00286EE6ED|nr:FAD-binding oxidoreductase [Pseudovibrio sp. M1P-2-3]
MADILVLGAGMVGISSALALQERGHHVTVLDRREPGMETSYGNAGIIQAEAAEPYALPRDLATLTRYVLGLSNDVSWTLKGVVTQAPALIRYFHNSSPKRLTAIAQNYSQLISAACKDHAPLIEAVHADNLITRQGLWYMYRHERDLEKAALDLERMNHAYGVQSRVLDGQACRTEEPALTHTPAGAIHWQQSWSCSNPAQLTRQYAELFTQRGGTVATCQVQQLVKSTRGWRVLTSEGEFTSEYVVVALGPWSPALLKPLGYRISMVYKRGYHGHYKAPVPLQRPILDVDNGVVAATMSKGLRVSTGAALVSREDHANPQQLVRGVSGLSDLLEIGPRIKEPQWFGTRPCLPDMLPLVGPVPNHHGLFLNFGHGHQGFTLGPTTARILASSIDSRLSDLGAALSPASRL